MAPKAPLKKSTAEQALGYAEVVPGTNPYAPNRRTALGSQILDDWIGAGGKANYTGEGYSAFAKERANFYNRPTQAAPTPRGPSSGSTGSRSRGGGGGGGGGAAPGMTQEMFDQMLAALGARQGPVDLPDFQGQALGPFNDQLYKDMEGRLAGAYAADTDVINQQYANLGNTIQSNYTNPYVNAQTAQNPQMQAAMQGVMANAGANPTMGGYAESVNAANLQGGNSNAAFANLMGVLGAINQQSQTSRMNQIGMDQNTAQQGLRAQNTGLSGGIGLARGRAQQDWQTRADERNYQNQMMGQQWNREELMRNQDLGAQQLQQRMQPLLDLIAQTAGTGINTGGIQQLLAQLTGQ